jgi:hypothetical protein
MSQSQDINHEELKQLIAYRDSILSVLRTASVDTKEFERSTALVINDFATRCVEGEVNRLDGGDVE